MGCSVIKEKKQVTQKQDWFAELNVDMSCSTQHVIVTPKLYNIERNPILRRRQNLKKQNALSTI